MAAKILHFGWDDCYRLQVLRVAGYDVLESETLAELCDHLQRVDRWTLWFSPRVPPTPSNRQRPSCERTAQRR